MSRAKNISYAAVVGIVVLIAVSAFLLKQINIQSYMQEAIDWIDSLGYFGPVIFVFLYIATAGFILPVILLTMIGGILFGVATGSIVVSIAFCSSSAILFIIGYTFGDKIVPDKIKDSKKYKAVRHALSQDGFKIVFLMRFVPVISSIILNLVCGVTRIRFKDFILGTFLGQLPGTVLYTYVGFVAGDLLTAQNNANNRTPTDWIVLGIGLLATVVAFLYISKKSKLALRQIDNEI